ncbi:MAG TPA: HEAT repeat domain-containing protein, partial [Gemmataceae bacterium]|nr:HEAT repeat domain-containing protein [Gemmataceae bacterium]
EMGGDYRGATRQLRFSVVATDERGREVADPDPHQMCLGGLVGPREIKPGQKHYESLALLRYRRFDRPGTYRLSVSHDFGWSEKDPSKFPSAHGTIRFLMPTAKQAQQVVEEMYALSTDDRGSAGQKQKPYADFRTLIYPVYLPVLAPHARDGSEKALEAIGAMPTPEATRELVRLLKKKNPMFVRHVVQTLNARLPDPQLEGKLRPRSVFEFDFDHRRRWLVKESWRDEFAPPVREMGRALLGEKDAEGVRCGAYILECLGRQEEVEGLVAALERAAQQAKDLPREENVYPRPRGACQELVRAAVAMSQRGVKVKETPQTAGELLLFTCAFRSREKFRPEGWEEAFVRALRHDLPYVREVALESLPLTLPKRIRGLLPKLLADRDVDVQIAACRLAERLKAPELREPVLNVLRTAQESWLLNAAGNAGHALGLQAERIRVYASRLDEEAVAVEFLRSLVYSVIAKTYGHSSPSKLDAATRRACKQAWKEFLDRHGKALAAGKKFNLSDPALPRKELFPGFTFDPPPRKPDR